MNLLFVLAAMLFQQAPPSQTIPTKVDSVEHVLSLLQGFKKLDTMRWLARQYRFTNTKRGIELLQEVIAISRQQVKYNPAKTYMELGVQHTILAKHDEALRYYDSATIAGRDDPKLLANLYNNKAILFTFKEQYDEALEYYLKGLEANEKINNNDGIMRSYAGIAWVYHSNRAFEKAIEYQQKSLDLSIKLKDKVAEHTALGNMANTLQSMKRNEEARDINKKVIAFFEQQSPGSITIGNIYFNMSKVYSNMSKWDSSYYFAKKSADIFTEREAVTELAYSYSHTARAAMAMKKLQLAEDDALKGYEANKKLGRGEELEYNAFMLVKIGAYKHDLEMMDKYERELEGITDSIQRKGQAKAVAEIQTRYETSQKENENQLLKNEAELQEVRLSRSRYIGFSSLVGAGLLALVAVTLYQRNQQRKRFNRVLQTENEKLKVEMLVAQLNQLKDQINPHFLFNSLATLQSMAQENDPNTGLFIQKLSEVYRYILQTNSDNLVSLNEELKVAEAYMFMLNARFENALVTSIHIDNELLSKKLPPFSLQLLVENAIKHNSATHNNPLKIEITASNDEVIVRNNLQRKRSVVDSTKIGLVNLQKRFSLLGAKSVSIEHGTTEFVVRLPLYE